MAIWNSGIHFMCLLVIGYSSTSVPSYHSIYGGPKDSEGGPSMDLNGDYDHIVLVPESYGDSENFLASIRNSFVNIYGGIPDPVSVFSNNIRVCLTGGNVLKRDLGPKRVLLVQMGNNFVFGNTDVMRMLTRIHSCLGWDVRVLMNRSDVVAHLNGRLVGPNWEHVLGQYGFFLRVGSGAGLSRPSALFVSSGIDMGWLDEYLVDTPLTEIDTSRIVLQDALVVSERDGIYEHFVDSGPLGSSLFVGQSDDHLCKTVLPRILFSFNVARIFVSLQTEFFHRVSHQCGGRLVFVDVEMGRGHPNRRSRDGMPFALIMDVVDNFRKINRIVTVYGMSPQLDLTAALAPESSLPLFASMELPISEYSFVIVVSDLHGDYEYGVSSLCLGIQQSIRPDLDCNLFYHAVDSRMVDLLHSGVVNVQPILGTGSSILVVQMGDLVDRGPQSKKLYLLFDHMSDIVGFKSVALLGNHELIQHTNSEENNFEHYWRPEVDLQVYGPDAASRFAEFRNGHIWDLIFAKHVGAIRLGNPVADPNPLSSAGNPNTLFVHGGIDLAWFDMVTKRTNLGLVDSEGLVRVDRLNFVVRKILAYFAPVHIDELLNDPKAPFWTRTLANEPETPAFCTSVVRPILKAFRVARIVVGHSPQEDGLAKSRCGGRILLTDVATSRWMRGGVVGQPMATVMRFSVSRLLTSVTAHYAAEIMSPPMQQLVPSVGPTPLRIHDNLRPLVSDANLGPASLVGHHAIFQRAIQSRPAPGAPMKRPRLEEDATLMTPISIAFHPTANEQIENIVPPR